MSTTTRAAAAAAAARVTDENADALLARKAAKGGAGGRRALGEITNRATSATNALGFHAKKPASSSSSSAAESAGGVLSLAAATKIRRTVTTKAASSNSAAARRAKAAALANAVKKESAFAVSDVSSSVPDVDASAASSAVSPMSTSDRRAKAEPVPLHFGFPSCAVPAAALRALPPGVVDIDAADAGDHLSECRFAGAIHRNLLSREADFMADARYMDAQADITVKMRAILIDWLVDVHLKFKLQTETLHLTINIIDRFLEAMPVVRRKLQLVGVTAMLISSKYEEIYAPETADFVYISDKAYSKDEILAMEALILNKLNFCVTVPSALVFLRRTLKAVRAVHGDDMLAAGHLAHYCVELSLQDAEMLRFRPSERAAAACLLAGKLVHDGVHWNETMRFHSGDWDAAALEECERELRRVLENERDPANSNKLTAIKRKFAAPRYMEISTIAAGLDLAPDCTTSMDICSRD